MDLDARITAPIKQGQSFGSVNISLGDEQYAKRKLIALSPIESGGLFGNLVDEIKLLFE
jgi:D-alanyl-D-alanine carboxypeptidase (penicillin-binding protein 5/6)